MTSLYVNGILFNTHTYTFMSEFTYYMHLVTTQNTYILQKY